MVSWGYAFRRGLVIWLWTIVWGIIGGVIAIAISGGSLLALISDPTGNWGGAVVGMFAGVFIGGLIASIGGYATLVKVILESEEKPPA